MTDVFQVSQVNGYLAHKQHLRPGARLADAVQVTRHVVALHATSATSPYLSLWARMDSFQHDMLEEALYEQRQLAKVLCMRVTVHVVPSEEAPLFVQACRAYVEKRTPPRFRGAGLLVLAGLCSEEEADSLLQDLYRRVLDVLAERGSCTAQEISDEVPEFRAKIRHDVGKPYEGEFSIGSRLVNDMAAQGLIIRARPRGSWRSNLYEYAAFSDWLPDVDMESVAPQEARAWLVRRYLAAFGPATLDDVQWWTGFTQGDVKKALQAVQPLLAEVAIESLGDGYFMLADDVPRLCEAATPDVPCAFLLPSLDPYIMGYRDRRRFLAPEHADKVFDRSGNALPTVWVNGRVVGAWGQRKENGRVVYGLFEPLCAAEQDLLGSEAQRLDGFLAGDPISPAFFHTPFTRALQWHGTR